MRARNDEDGIDFADLRGGFRSGVDTGLDRCDVAGEETADETGADLGPAVHGDVSGFDRRIRGFDKRGETHGFDDSKCLFGHYYELVGCLIAGNGVMEKREA